MKRLQGSRKMGWLILAVALVPVVVVVLMIDDWGRDWTTNTAETDASADDVDLRPLHAEVEPERLQAAVEAFVQQQRPWQVESQQVEANGLVKMHLTRRTRVFRFVDDIHIRIEPDGGGDLETSVLHARSASRVGKGDLGQNPRNLKTLLRGVREQL